MLAQSLQALLLLWHGLFQAGLSFLIGVRLQSPRQSCSQIFDYVPSHFLRRVGC
jgi:hypothetical protein